ncbi:MAG: hypothetical protein J5908_07860, partial [Selenomonas sp.]|nr:hypothetical protein [Selenomonas sp.]
IIADKPRRVNQKQKFLLFYLEIIILLTNVGHLATAIGKSILWPQIQPLSYSYSVTPCTCAHQVQELLYCM